MNQQISRHTYCSFRFNQFLICTVKPQDEQEWPTLIKNTCIIEGANTDTN